MTEAHQDIFDDWVGDVISNMSDSYFPSWDVRVDFVCESGNEFDNWCDKLFFFGKTPEQAAAIIERAYKLYINMIDKVALDRYITAEPDDDHYGDWVELILDNLPQDYYDENFRWFDSSPTVEKWYVKLFRKDTDVELAARIIHRAHKLYINR